jgi:hypothetical protein
MVNHHKNEKKKKHPPHRRQLRNAASPNRPARRLPRAIVVQGGGASPPPDPENKKTWGTETLKTAGGAVGAALACAYISRENWIPPQFVTGIVTAVGATLAVLGRNETLRNVGSGVMSAAGAQLGLMLIDNHYDNLETHQRIAVAQADKAQAEKAKAEKALADKAKATRSAEALPPGALESAYERARMRLAMAQAASQMAA